METTKTGRLQRIVLPQDIVDILLWHLDRLPPGPMRESELLFRARPVVIERRAASVVRSPRSRRSCD
jgi:hypothetical protein